VTDLTRGRTARRVLWWCAGLVTLAGFIIVAVGADGASTSASFGWFAYQPLSSMAFAGPVGIVLTPATVVGGILAVVGLLALSFLFGYLVATSRASRRPSAR